MKFKQPLFAAACLALTSITTAFAQSAAAPRPPSGGMFGATRSDVGGRDKLNFTFQLAQGVDSALPPEASSQVSRGLDNGGWSTVLQAASDYAHTGRRLQLTGDASTALKYYRELGRVDALSHNAAVGAGIKVPHGNLRLTQAVTYSPMYLYQLFPTNDAPELGESIPVNPAYQIEETESYLYNTDMALVLGSSRGTQVTASGGFNRTDFSEQAMSRSDLDVYDAGLEVSRRLSSRGSVSAGYEFRSGEFGYGGPTTEHLAKFGVEYSPALSRTRRATFRLDLLPSRIELPVPVLDGTTEVSNQRLNRLSAEASVDVPFRPNWRTSARYRRSLEYLSVLDQPVFADAGRVELSGLLTRRLDLSVSAGYVTAASALTQSTEPLETYTGQVSMRYALKRSVAVTSEYSYYYYDVGGQRGLTPGLPDVYEQHGLRVGVMLYLETLGR